MSIFPIQRFTVSGNSMLPTLKHGQDVLVWCWFYQPKAGDMVVIKKNGKEMIKRVRQMSSDPLRLVGDEASRGAFVQGDNEKESTDSRNFGWINKKDIIGKVIWP